MSPITAEEAWDATDPSQSDEARQLSAERIMAGVAANDGYIASRTELEQYVLHARGGQVVSHAELNSEGAEAVGPTGSAALTADAEGTAVDEPSETPSLGAGDTDADTLAKLRKQLEDAGLTPEV